jgi:hypothetical protein
MIQFGKSVSLSQIQTTEDIYEAICTGTQGQLAFLCASLSACTHLTTQSKLRSPHSTHINMLNIESFTNTSSSSSLSAWASAPPLTLPHSLASSAAMVRRY